ncbi:MAG: PilX N-terminal domain-containing pilus assembly protein, partial [Methylocystaceae bacterium]
METGEVGRRRISSHQGSVLLLTLMVLLSLTIIETLAVSLTLLELRMTAYDSRIKQAQQAADAGLEATKASLVASMIAGKTPVQALSRAHPEWNGGSSIPWTISLGENQQARVDMPDLSRINTQGLIRIKSRGVYLNAAQSLQADLLYTNTAAYGLCTRELGISGHFMEIESLGTTEWLPRGVLQVTGSQMACKSEIPTAVPANCLHHITDASGVLVHSPPPTTAHLNDFMLGSSVQRDFIPPIIKAVQLKPCRKNAEQDSALWQIWTSSNFSAGNIHKPFHYVEGNLG